MADGISTSHNSSSVSQELAQMKEITAQMASLTKDSTVQVTETDIENCSDVNILQTWCLGLRKERVMQRTQLDSLQVERQLETKLNLEYLDKLRDALEYIEEVRDILASSSSSYEQGKTEFSLEMLVALKEDLACSICKEVSEAQDDYVHSISFSIVSVA
jgi:hypothetical protein